MSEIHLIIRNSIQNKSAVSVEDGQKIFDEIVKAFKQNSNVLLDFNELTHITSMFLNAAIGQLYNQYDSEFLNKNLKIKNMTSEDMNLLKRVINRAKEYFRDRKKIDASINSALNNG